jgi:hypothetical protein
VVERREGAHRREAKVLARFASGMDNSKDAELLGEHGGNDEVHMDTASSWVVAVASIFSR